MGMALENTLLIICIIALSSWALISYKDRKLKCLVLSTISIMLITWLAFNVYSLYKPHVQDKQYGSIYKNIK